MKFNYHDCTEKEKMMICMAAVRATGLEINPEIGKSLEIELTINGIKVDFISFTKLYSDQIHRIARGMAKEMIGKIAGDVRSVIYDKLDEMGRDVENVIAEKL